MTVLPENASELANIAHDVGAIVLQGRLSYSSESGGFPAQ